ncbi:GntR family transcriptional regulator [Paenibacillus sp. NFR01]|uniref:GntR family transcriptional regulator n=1 Tax=Paenibacillus sp. NFR01 TaxID=1566279 RepID=UPI0008C21A53|nr:GntR family transcriptional regulator [Paenibacillus sp. NFR01]SEU19248.1 DNA-binding transcriptional regulator YhcF, GntR family [Paenibacillus sp. NFR01]
MEHDVELLPEPFRLDPSLPIYEQLVDAIRRQIVAGRIPPGTRLPSVRDLAAGRNINPTTAARTYQELERLGLIVTYRGQGTFVAQDMNVIANARKDMMRKAIRDFKALAASLGLTAQQLLDFDKEDADDNHS